MKNSTILDNSFSSESDTVRPLYEQILLSHLDDLCAFIQYDCITNEEAIKAYHTAVAIINMFIKNNRPIANHHIEWLIELSNQLF